MTTSSYTNPYAVFTLTSSTNIGPLTTPVSLPADCLSSLWDFQTPGLWPTNPSGWTYYTQGCAASSCCPSRTPYTAAYQWVSSYYSPAVCPESYQACSGPSTMPSSPGETVAFCCPQNYLCPADPVFGGWWACQSARHTTTVAYLMDNLQNQQTLQTEPVTDVGHWDVVYPIQIRWKAGDFATETSNAGSALVTSEAGSAGTASSVSLNAASGVQVTAQPSSSATPARPLSGGAKIGLGVGLGVFALFAATLVGWWALRRRRRNVGQQGPPISEISPDHVYPKAELAANDPWKWRHKSELDASNASKRDPAAELEAKRVDTAKKGVPAEMWAPVDREVGVTT